MSAAGELVQRLARVAGVSPSAVTLALQDSPRISLETKERVYRTARKIGYRESKRHTLHSLNFAVLYCCSRDDESLASSPDVAIWEGITDVANQRGVSVYCSNLHLSNGRVRFEQLPVLLRRDQIDGVFLLSSLNEPLLDFLQQMRLPVVIVSNVQPTPHTNQVRVDSDQGLRELVTRLHERGQRRFGFVSAASKLVVNQQFFESYRRALRELGCFDPRLAVRDRELYPDTVASTLPLLRSRPSPTVMFATSSRTAQQVAIAAASAGIPFDSGFEIATADPDENLRLGYPLHLVKVDLAEMGRRAFERLIELRVNPAAEPQVISQPCTVILRPSAHR